MDAFNEPLPPHSREAEQGLLGCLLLDPQTVMPLCQTRLKGKEVFYDLCHQSIYEQLASMWEKQTPIDLITVTNRLRDAGLLEVIGGVAYIATLQDATPSPANAEYYLTILAEKRWLRNLRNVCDEVKQQAVDTDDGVDEIANNLEAKLLACTEERLGGLGDQVASARELMAGVLDLVAVEEECGRTGKHIGIESGFIDYDRMLSGLQRGKLHLIAARPGTGKTSILCSVALNAAIETGTPVLIVSLEMSAASLLKRMVHIHSRVSVNAIRRGQLTERDIFHMAKSTEIISKAPIHIVDSKGMTAPQIASLVRSHKRKHGVQLVGIDYVQKVAPHTKHNLFTYQIRDVSGVLQEMVQRENVAGVFLAQLNRDTDKTKGAEPDLRDLADSGALETDADVVTFLWHDPEDYKQSDYHHLPNWNFFLSTKKNRDGETGRNRLVFTRNCTRFDNAARVQM